MKAIRNRCREITIIDDQQVGSVSPFSSHLYSTPGQLSSQDALAGGKPPLTRSENNVGRWDEKSVGKGISLLLPRTSCLLSKRSFLFIFERPSLVAILSLLQTNTVTMLHLSGGCQISTNPAK